MRGRARRRRMINTLSWASRWLRSTTHRCVGQERFERWLWIYQYRMAMICCRCCYCCCLFCVEGVRAVKCDVGLPPKSSTLRRVRTRFA
jgi:hypothetical protein